MLMFGAITGGLAYNIKITLTDAARVASRYATTHPIPLTIPNSPPCTTSTTISTTTAEWLVDVACEAISNAQGALDENASGRMVCVTYAPPGSDLSSASTLEWNSTNSGSVTTGSSCPQATLTPSSTDTVVEVVVQRSSDINAVVFDRSVNLVSSSFGRYEESS